MNPKEQEKCCEKCSKYFKEEKCGCCSDPSCSCHTPPTDSKGGERGWEEEWDSAFNWVDKILEYEIGRWKMMYGFTPKELKEQVKKIIASEKEAYKKELIKELGIIESEEPSNFPTKEGQEAVYHVCERFLALLKK